MTARFGTTLDAGTVTAQPQAGLCDKLAAVVGLAALASIAGIWPSHDTDHVQALGDATEDRAGQPAIVDRGGEAVNMARDIDVGAYGGVSYTHPSTVTIRNPGRTEMTVKDFGWDGKPFKSPVYYGIRALSTMSGTRFSGMLDYTHAKAIARPDDVAAFAGQLDGKPLAPKAKIGEVFRHLEFSHGHNIVTLNGIMRLGTLMPRVRPYLGLGAGITLPHTEIGYWKDENLRTYEYQYAGLAGQALAGAEVKLGRVTVFIEYKLTYTPYDVPLSGVRNGHLLVTDVWRQFRAWMKREIPPEGRLATTLVTHHAIAGTLVRVSGQPSP